MDAVVDLEAWRRARYGDRAGWAASWAQEEARVSRLERAVDRLHALVSGSLDARGRLEPRVETEMLAIMGELSVGLVTEAASRAERLADKLASRKEAPRA